MMQFMSRIFLVAFIISGCSSMLVQKRDLTAFDKGLALMYNEEAYKAKKLWELVCADEKIELACWAQGRSINVPAGLAVMQGGTDESSTQVAILAKKKDKLRVYLRDTKSGKLIKESGRKESSRSHSDYVIVQMDYAKLGKGIDYNLLVANDNGDILDSRTLRTVLVSGNKLRFAITSCMDDSYHNVQETQWNDLITLAPEVILMIGDNTYVDLKMKTLMKEVSPELIWDRHAETRDRLAVFRQKKLTPVFAVWDDHDYGLNNGGRDFPHKEASKAIFEEFFPQQMNGAILAKGPGLSQFVRLREQNFIFFDDRTFRTSPELKSEQVHFGDEQEDWALNLMKANKGPFWLISGDQYFGAYHPHESYQGNHPVAFEKFLKKLKSTGRRYIFVSGDRHLTEIMKIPVKQTGFQTYELTSSGIHATVFPGSLIHWPNKLDIEGVDGTMNYMMIESSAKGAGVTFKVTSYGPEKKLLFQRDLRVH